MTTAMLYLLLYFGAIAFLVALLFAVLCCVALGAAADYMARREETVRPPSTPKE